MSADGGSFLVLLAIAMFAGAVLPGILPLSCNLSSSRLKTVSVFGAGLLIGTALIVVVPEGIHMWYSLKTEEHGSDHAAEVHVEGAGHSHEHGGEKDWLIGLSLAVGFVFMVFVDRFGGSHGHSHGASTTTHDIEKEDDGSAGQTRIEDVKSWSATFGLGVHAAVDGIALGSASVTNNSSLSMLVFFAIMLHKGPAAFGLASFLLNLGASRESGALSRHPVELRPCSPPHFLSSLSSPPFPVVAAQFGKRSSGFPASRPSRRW